jgi:hypothetical protein
MEGVNEVQGKRKRTRPRKGRVGGLFVLKPILTRFRSGVLQRIADLRGLEHLNPWGKTMWSAPAFPPATPLFAFMWSRLWGRLTLPVVNLVAVTTSEFTRFQYQRENLC